ncbi:unknown [Firmicutes bacterium CAG:631]|nr:unknown [Firmicutes bacterium CAG:631]
MNKEEMKRRLEENVEPKYNKQRNLEEIKSNLTFTNEKEIMESMVQEKQQQTKRFRWITTLSIIFACVLLIGTNCMTYALTHETETIIVNGNEIPQAFLKNNFKNYSQYPISSKSIKDTYCIEIYKGIDDNNETKFVYYIYSYFLVDKNLQITITLESTNEKDIIEFNTINQYVLGILMIDDLMEGNQLRINFSDELSEISNFFLVL